RIALLRGRRQRRLDRVEDHFPRYALLVGNRINDQQQFLAHLDYSARDGLSAAGFLVDLLDLFLPGRASRPDLSLAGARPKATQSGTRRAFSMLSTDTTKG